MNKLLGGLLCFLSLSCNVVASGFEYDLSGNITQRLLYSDNYTIYGSDGDGGYSGATDLTLLGQVRFADKLSFSLKGNLRDRYYGTDADLVYAQLNINELFGVRNTILSLGRVKTDIGLYSYATYDPNLRSTVFLPFTIYREDLALFANSFDGLTFRHNLFFDDIVLSNSVSLGYPILEKAQPYFYPIDIPDFHIEPRFSGLFTTQLSNTTQDFTLKYSLAVVKFDEQMVINMLSFEKFFGDKHRFTTEFMINSFRSKEVLMPQYILYIPQVNMNHQGGYVEYEYRPSKKLSFTLRYEQERTDLDNPLFLPHDFTYSNIRTAGVSYKVNKSLLLQFQASMLEGKSVLQKSTNWPDDLFNMKDNTDTMLAFSISYLF